MKKEDYLDKAASHVTEVYDERFVRNNEYQFKKFIYTQKGMM